MTKVSFSSLYNARCKDGKPFYWQPKELPNHPLSYDGEKGVQETVHKILKSSLMFEIEVRDYIHDFWKTLGDNINPIAKNLVASNIKDEDVHAKQIENCLKTYSVSNKYDLDIANFKKQWQEVEAHPIEKVAILEVGVFLAASLPVLLRYGGHSLAWVSTMIKKDEQRHVAVGLGMLNKLNYSIKNNEKLNSLRRGTIAYLLDTLKLPGRPAKALFNHLADQFLEKHGELRKSIQPDPQPLGKLCTDPKHSVCPKS